MGKTKATVNADTPVEPAIIVLGRDESGKAHASWFGAADVELAEKAAGIMRMKVLRVSTPEHRAAALGLAAGRVFASGKGLVPFAKEAAYEALNAFDGAYEPLAPVEPEPDPQPVVTNVPSSWSDLKTGSLVLAAESPTEPWYPTVIVEAKGAGLFVCRWRDWADEPVFVRRGEDLALLAPGFCATDATGATGEASGA